MLLAEFSLFLLSLACLSDGVAAQRPYDPRLVGTWTTKSGKVLTGSGFYDPVKDRFNEPSHTGISYSFTIDGFYEEAHYRAMANPTQPNCARGMMQFQHGKYEIAANGSLILTPFGSDGRQLVSNRCAGPNAYYSRYIQEELFERYEVLKDPYSGVERLNLYQFDGTPVHPMYLASRQPQMLPTETLNPIDTSSSKGKGKGKRDGSVLERREQEGAGLGVDFESLLNKNASVDTEGDNNQSGMDTLWWVGVFMTAVGGLVLIYK
ncbi:ROT1 protein [Paracoccidioides lutzii Pb01]|uniref:Protein ROT1 n=1 Tax=Paracoccidioides lutzii (strain ATCC MYA-826 / Pb01) TaxID=502779 RepID=C1GYW4_PARBA|nr:ROT1 protein [Paracoccidioides lutzii Pb01]EEH41787.1 ROT1 protein [Paracoccidioides lutzii Pb01]